MAFDVDGARAAGYTTAEINDYLAKDSNYDAVGARKAGYSDDEIFSHLSGPKEPRAKGFVEGLGYGAKHAAGLLKNSLNDAATAVFDNPVGRGIDRAGQAIGLDSMYDVDSRNKAALEAHKGLAPTDTAGKIGNVLGTVAVAAPTMLIPGAGTYKGAALIGAGTGALLSDGGSAGQRVEDAAMGATGGLVGRAIVPAVTAASRGVSDSVKTLIGTSTKEPTMAKAAEALSQKASGLYDQAEAAGVMFKQSGVQRVADDITQAVGRPNAVLRPKTTGMMQELEDLQAAGDISLTRLDEFRQMIGKEMKNAQPSDMRTLQIMKDKLDDFGDNVAPTDVTGNHANGVQLLKDARKAWQMKSKAQALDDIYGVAELNSGSQTNNQALGTIINGFKSLAKNPKKMRAFSPEEQQQIKAIVVGGPSERVLRLVGRFSPTGPISGGIGGAALVSAGPIGLALPAAGMMAKNAATKVTQRKINALEDLIMRGQSVPGTRLMPQQLPQQSQSQDVLMRILQSGGIAVPNVNQ